MERRVRRRARQRKFHHDQLAQSNYLNVGGIVSYTLTGTVDVFASYQSTVWGENVHPLQPGLAVGLSGGFSPRLVIRSLVAKSPAGCAPAE